MKAVNVCPNMCFLWLSVCCVFDLLALHYGSRRSHSLLPRIVPCTRLPHRSMGKQQGLHRNRLNPLQTLTCKRSLYKTRDMPPFPCDLFCLFLCFWCPAQSSLPCTLLLKAVCTATRAVQDTVKIGANKQRHTEVLGAIFGCSTY